MELINKLNLTEFKDRLNKGTITLQHSEGSDDFPAGSMRTLECWGKGYYNISQHTCNGCLLEVYDWYKHYLEYGFIEQYENFTTN
jgi:hypothetical protein